MFFFEADSSFLLFSFFMSCALITFLIGFYNVIKHRTLCDRSAMIPYMSLSTELFWSVIPMLIFFALCIPSVQFLISEEKAQPTVKPDMGFVSSEILKLHSLKGDLNG